MEDVLVKYRIQIIIRSIEGRLQQVSFPVKSFVKTLSIIQDNCTKYV